MTAKRRTISDAEFEAKCLALLDEVAETGEELVVTREGRAVARVLPANGGNGTTGTRWREYDDGLAGSVTWEGDILSPVGEGDWEVLR